MSSNFKRQTNRLQFAALLRGVIITAFLTVAGLSYVYLKNQLHVCGNQRKGLEQELNELVSENSVMEAQISRLTSRAALQRRMDEGFIKLVPITSQCLGPHSYPGWQPLVGRQPPGGQPDPDNLT